MLIKTPVGNYYGTVIFEKKEDGKCYLKIKDWDDSESTVEISADLFELAQKEFDHAN